MVAEEAAAEKPAQQPCGAILRSGLDEAAQYLVEARTELLNPESRARIDEYLRVQMKDHALAEFAKFLSFSLADGFLTKEDEANLKHLAPASGSSSRR